MSLAQDVPHHGHGRSRQVPEPPHWPLDLKAQEKAKEMGIALSRTQMPNDDPLLVTMLAELVEKRVQEIL